MDGCRGGWVYFALVDSRFHFGLVPDMASLLRRFPIRRVCIDIPIGLPSAASGPRRCDQRARALLGPRRSSVFSPPIREILGLSSYAAANSRSRELAGRGLSCQSFNITPKIAEVDRLIAADTSLRPRLLEAHPELCFWGLAGGEPMAHSKKTRSGFEERLVVLEDHWPDAARVIDEARTVCPRRSVAIDDLVDALALAVTAARPAFQLVSLTDRTQFDSRGLPMDMVYYKKDTQPAPH